MSANAPTPPTPPLSAPTPVAPPLPPPAPPHPGPELLARTKIPFQVVDHALKGYHLDATVAADTVPDVAAELDREGFAIDTITGVDWLATGSMEVVYDFFYPRSALRVVIRTRVSRDNPELPSITSIFPGANWHERETHDFFGIRFNGHPNLTPFLLPEDATYHPLRKDFAA